MEAGVTIFYINSGKYIYRKHGGNKGYTTTNSNNSDRNIGSGLKVLRGDEEDEQVGIFNLVQRNPITGVHLKVDEAMEGCAGK